MTEKDVLVWMNDEYRAGNYRTGKLASRCPNPGSGRKRRFLILVFGRCSLRFKSKRKLPARSDHEILFELVAIEVLPDGN